MEARTPKPHFAFANSRAIGRLWRGKLKGWRKRSKAEGHVATCEVYKNKSGKSCWKGTKKLRSTEILTCRSIFFQLPAAWVQPMFVSIKKWNLGIPYVETFSHIYIKWFPTFWNSICLIPFVNWNQVNTSRFSKLSHTLREYPELFGMAMVDLFHDLTNSAQGFAAVPEPTPQAMVSFKKMDNQHGALQYARLEDVYTYLRGNRRLELPEHWKPLIPKNLDAWAQRMVKTYLL